MAHENFFDAKPTTPREPRLGVPPPHVNGHDDEDPKWLDQLVAYRADEPDPETIIYVEAPAEPYGVSLWVVRQAWQSSQILRRPWVARGYLMRGALTVVSGAGAAGKSSLMVGWATALTVGCSFRHLKTSGPMRVATYNVEDDEFEQKRRFSAMLNRLQLAPDAFGDRLAILGPSEVGTLLSVTRDGVVLNTIVMDELDGFVAEFRPDVLMLDPFVELHAAEENDNTAVRAVLAKLRAMAVKYGMSIVILHHTRKGIGDPGDPDTLRGASSIVGAARVVLTLNVMTKDEAESFKIPEKTRKHYFRLDGAKSNYAAIEDAEWFERQEITLDNGDENEPADRVAVAWPWEPPQQRVDASTEQLNEALDTLASPPAGWLYSPTRRGRDNQRWAGQVLIDTLGLGEKQAAEIVRAWLDSGLLYREEFRDDRTRKMVTGVRVDDSKRPTI